MAEPDYEEGYLHSPFWLNPPPWPPPPLPPDEIGLTGPEQRGFVPHWADRDAAQARAAAKAGGDAGRAAEPTGPCVVYEQEYTDGTPHREETGAAVTAQAADVGQARGQEGASVATMQLPDPPAWVRPSQVEPPTQTGGPVIDPAWTAGAVQLEPKEEG